MISRIFIIASGGLLAYSKSFVESDELANDNDLISGFITAISNFAVEIKGGKINSLNFRNFNFVFSYDDEVDCMFVLVIDIHDLENEAKDKVELLKNEFINRYRSYLMDWTGEVTIFKGIDDFVDENIFIPPKLLLIGEDGVGKSTIMDLFPGETILELDEDLNEIIQKPINVEGIDLKQFILREINLEEIIDNSKIYRPLLDSVDIVCIVTNSAASNLGRTQRLTPTLKNMVKKADFFIIANFQDLKDQAFEPEKIEESFGIKTYGFSAKKNTAKEDIFNIMVEILNSSIIEKSQKKQLEILKDENN